jgi:nitrilase
MTSAPEVEANLASARTLLERARVEGASLAVLPENFAIMGHRDVDKVEVAETPGEGPIQAFLGHCARELGLWIIGGTIPLRVEGEPKRVAAASMVFDERGRCVARYDKIHLFDVDASAGTAGRAAEPYKESASTLAGERVVSAATPLGRIGLTICYDIRFPALFHRLSVLGVDVLVVPAAFTVPTGQVHWQPLLQARAIESLVYVVAAGQCGEHAGGRKTYGHSLVIGPWGEVLGQLTDGPGVLCVDLDMIRLSQLRESFPVVRHRREL